MPALDWIVIGFLSHFVLSFAICYNWTVSGLLIQLNQGHRDSLSGIQGIVVLNSWQEFSGIFFRFRRELWGIHRSFFFLIFVAVSVLTHSTT